MAFCKNCKSWQRINTTYFPFGYCINQVHTATASNFDCEDYERKEGQTHEKVHQHHENDEGQ